MAAKKNNVSRIWGGRFGGEVAEIMAQLNASIGFDKVLYAQDIACSKAHAEMLAAQKIISKEDLGAIKKGLTAIQKEIESGAFAFDTKLEDIHMNIEARLTELIGDAGKRLHTARSRNDQVATDLRLWVREASDTIITALTELRGVLLTQAEKHVNTLMPGLTHLQTAQPVVLAHHLLAYVEMFERDRERFKDARKRMNESPLGAAALGGTRFPIDRHKTAKALGFDAPMRNSMDAVSDRDFVVEFLAAASLTAIHLSRFAEEIVLWSSDRFGFITLGDKFSTGSSIMPQKRNPDAAELIRAKSGRIIGSLVAMLAVLKGLPLTYGKDLQEDKEPLFDASASLLLALKVTGEMLRHTKFNPQAMRDALNTGFPTATDLADWLVRELNLSFREAHGVSGKLVALAEKKKLRLDELTLADFKSVHKGITKEVFKVLSPENSVASRSSFGGTAPKAVRDAIKKAKRRG